MAHRLMSGDRGTRHGSYLLGDYTRLTTERCGCRCPAILGDAGPRLIDLRR